MKGNKIKSKKPQMRKVRNLRDHADVYYTMPDWGTKEIDGVTFIYVVKNIGIRDMPKLMRKDSVEFFK